MRIDPQVLQEAKSGKAAAFNEVVLEYRGRVLRTLARIIGRPDDAEDVAQEVFTRLYFNLAQLRETATFETWLHRMTVHAAYDYLRGPRGRRNRREARMADVSEARIVLADAAAGARAHAEERHRQAIRDLAAQLLAAVKEEDRILLILREVEEMSVEELAQVYHVSRNAVKVRLFRARQRALKAFYATCCVRPAIGDRRHGCHAGNMLRSEGQTVPC
jgi:RNA polymerase sigma-70 factor, ECF subfamily